VRRWPATAGLVLVVLSVLLVAQRAVAGWGLLPNSFFGVGSFRVVDLGLLPEGLLLLLASQLLRMRGARRALYAPPAIVGLLVVVLVTAVVVGMNWLLVPVLSRSLGWGRFGVGPPVAVTDLREITSRTSIEFPPGSTLEQGRYVGGLSPELAAKVHMPLDEWPGFLRQTGSAKANDFSTQSRALANADGALVAQGGWWNPDSVGRFVSGQVIVRGGPGFVKLLVDLDDPSTAIVYLYWSG